VRVDRDAARAVRERARVQLGAQLTVTRPVRAIDPLTRRRRPLITALIFVRVGEVPGGCVPGTPGGGGGVAAWFRTVTVGDVAAWLLPAASTTTTENVCGPSPTRRVSTLSEPSGSCGQGAASVKSHVCVAPMRGPPASART
jgi:hypothetical protein